MVRRLLYTFLLLLVIFICKAQDFSNKGNEFWVGYGYHQAMQSDNGQNMVLYFTAEELATVKVDIPALGWSRTYQVASNTVTESDPIPKAGTEDARLLHEGIYNTGIHITSDKPIVAYAHIYNASVSAASLLFPVSTLGQDYYSLNFTQKSNIDSSNSWAYAIATEDNTAIEIVPSANTLTHSAGQPFIVTLNKGQIYNLKGYTDGNNGSDLTGTRIRSISSGTNGCKKIAVFSGSGRVSISCSDDITTSDNLFQQAFPQSAWGRKFLTVPTIRLPNNYFRIAVSDPSTIVTIDGVQATNLINGFYYEIMANAPKSIVASKPVMVAQYITSTNTPDAATCGNSNDRNGDPEMIYLSPVEQTIDKITLNSTKYYQIASHFINVVIKTVAVNSFTLDGTVSPSSFVPHPQDPAYSYAVFPVSAGPHILKADSGFNAIAYGYGITESYGYNAGTNIKDLYQYLSLQNPYALVNSPVTCQNTPFSFSITLPYPSTSLTWNFGNNPDLVPNRIVTNNNIVADSTFIRDGRNFYVYKLTGLYKFTSVGTFPVKIIANNQTTDGCGGLQEINYTVQVTRPPVADFSFSHNGCLSDTAVFSDASSGNGRTLSARLWNFSDGSIDTVPQFHKAFSTAGLNNVKLTSINDIGCSHDTSKTIVVAPQPTAKFGYSKIACTDSTITFTDSSAISSGSIVKWNWNFGDGTTVTNLSNSPATKKYATPGAYVVKLVTEAANGCKSDTALQTINISPSPVANFITPRVCVNDPFAAFTDSSYIPGNPNALLTYTWNFGDPNASATYPNASAAKNPQHKYAAAGIYNVSLTVTSTGGCSSGITKQVTVNSASPKADFTVLNSGMLCANTKVSVQNNSSVDVGSITRLEILWDAQNAPFIVETDSVPVTGKVYSHTYPSQETTQTYQVKVRVFSGVNCSSENILPLTINATPKVTFSVVPDICQNDSIRLISQASETTGLPGTFTFSGNGITPAGVFNPAVAGTHVIQYTFTSANGCKDSASQNIRVVPNPVVQLPAQVFVLEGGSVQLTPSITGNVTTYTWSPATYLSNASVQNPVSTPKADISYRLTVTSLPGCKGSADVAVLVLKALAIPNAFSPNGDGINDVWTIKSLEAFNDCTVQVFNRYGKIVFNTTGYNKPWDGTFNGSALPVGVYYYTINIKNGKNTYTGSVTILR